MPCCFIVPSWALWPPLPFPSAPLSYFFSPSPGSLKGAGLMPPMPPMGMPGSALPPNLAAGDLAAAASASRASALATCAEASAMAMPDTCLVTGFRAKSVKAVQMSSSSRVSACGRGSGGGWGRGGEKREKGVRQQCSQQQRHPPTRPLPPLTVLVTCTPSAARASCRAVLAVEYSMRILGLAPSGQW